MAITVVNVPDAVLEKLDAAFPSANLYAEEIKQGFTAPAFYVSLHPVTHDQLLGRRFIRSHPVVIHYYPLPEELQQPIRPRRHLHDVADQLYGQLHRIAINEGYATGTGMSHEIVDGVLHFFVTYSIHLVKARSEQPKMMSMETEETLK